MARSKSKIDIARVFAALGDPTRQTLIENLAAGPQSISRLAEPFDMSVTAVMQHVRVLEASGLVRTEKIGRVRTCRLEPTGLSAIERWARDRRSAWETALDRLGDLLAEDGG